jgi:hypothetical protein
MKKLLIAVFMLCMMFVPLNKVLAVDAATKLSTTATTIEAGQSFTITFSVANSLGIFGLSAALSYPTDKLEITASAAKSGFTLTLGSKLVVDHVESKTGNFDFATITFKAKSAFAIGEVAEIKISNVVASDGSKDVAYPGSSIKVSMVAPKSTNNYLSSLTTDAQAISFNKTTLTYRIIVENSVSSLTISATAEDVKAAVSGTGKKTLAIYTNKFSIVVTAENGAKRTYTLTVVRKDSNGNAGALSSNNKLSTLTVEGCNLSFSPDQSEYACEVENQVDKTSVSAQLADKTATYVINKPDTLSLGENKITVTVTAENGDLREYVITINRSSSAPTVPVDQLENVLKTLQANEIAIIEPDDGVISSELLQLVKQYSKTLVIKRKSESGKTLYEWYIDSVKTDSSSLIKTKLNFNSENQSLILELSNYAMGILLSFEENETLPENTEVKLNVSGQFEDGQKLSLYFYNAEEEKLEKVFEDLVVVEGYVIIPLEHTSEYYLTPAQVGTVTTGNQDQGGFLWIGIAAAEGLVILLLSGLLIRKKTALKH